MIKPSGWHTVRYDDLIEDKYLYNRCHTFRPNTLQFVKIYAAAPIKKGAAVLLFKMPEKEKHTDKERIKKIFIFLKFTDICKEVAKIDLIYFNHSQGKHKNLPETADKKISKKFETFLKIKDFCKEVAKITLI